MTLSKCDTQHNNALPCTECRYGECNRLFTIILSVIIMNVAMLCSYAECRFLFTITLSFIMLKVAMLSVVMLSITFYTLLY